MKYSVEVTRVTYEYAYVVVEADSAADAEEKAMDMCYEGTVEDWDCSDITFETYADIMEADSDL